MIETRNDEAGFIEFLNDDVATIVREIDAPCAILLDMNTSQVVGYRVYDPAPTNNLKAERTLTAEELQAIIDGCDGVTPGPWFMYGEPEVGLSPEPFSGSIGKGDMEPVYRWGPNLHHVARMDPQTVKAMASMALQSLSTQQPMGEVHTEASPEFQCEWDENEYTVSWKGGPWIHIFASGKIAVNDGTGIRSFMVQDLGASALHPNQESGE